MHSLLRVSLLVLAVLISCVSASSSFSVEHQSVDEKENAFTPVQLHLSFGDDDSIVVMWNTRTLSSSVVRYYQGRCSVQDKDKRYVEATGTSKQYEEGSAYVHTVVLEGVVEYSKSYCYQVGDPAYTMSKWYEWTNAEPNVAVFAALADTGTWGGVVPVMENLAQDTDLGFVIHAGDLSYAGDKPVPEKEAKWDTWGNLVEPVARHRPYMILPGNWDIKPFASAAYMSRYKMPLHPPAHPVEEEKFSYYYTFTHSIVRVVMVSSYDPYLPGSDQYAWLKNTLQMANKDRHDHPWLIVCFHSPMYSTSVGHGGGDEKFRAAIEDLLVEYHVDVAITGHDHGYERTYPVYNNTVVDPNLTYYVNPPTPIHILAGTGGADSDPWLPQPQWSAHRESSFGYTRFTATHTTLHVQYIRTNSSTGDEFWIERVEGYRPTWMVVVFVCAVLSVSAYHYKKIPGLLPFDVKAKKDEEFGAGEFGGKHV